jgi:UDP-3-O-[3-hydroxymyristoyl] glucosamine N-acyltransferase
MPTLGELAVRFGLELRGDPTLEVNAVATLQDARPGMLSFLANPKYRKFLAITGATAVVVDARSAANAPCAVLVAPNPYVAYARMAQVLHPVPAAAPGCHPSAVVDATASIAPSAHVAALAYVGPRAVIGERAFVGPGCVVEADSVVGDDTRLVARVTLGTRVRLGKRVILHPGVVVGGDGFGLAPDKDGWVKVPQVGGVVIGDDCEVGANTTIDRGAIEDTVLEEDVRLDNQIQVGHNVRIGAHTAIAACSGISGSTTIGKRCIIGGMVGFVGHLTVADGTIVTGLTMVSHSIHTGGVYSSGLPAEDGVKWRRTVAHLKRLDKLVARVKVLEGAIGLAGAAGDDTDHAEKEAE